MRSAPYTAALAIAALLHLHAVASRADALQPAARRTVTFATGTAVIEPAGDDAEAVQLYDRADQPTALSTCDANSGHYAEVVAFFVSFKQAVAAPSKASVAALVGFPLQVHAPSGRRHRALKSQAAFLSAYDTVFTDGMRRRIAAAVPNEVFCKNGMAMLGDGIVWESKRKVMVVNQ